ncbi:hypothetical protein VIGAN_09044300 [Vigna angularis var. angularis]|uniref:Uncharacterized protein n=1 Tax=Vigna angularis var. angularis TaxID=157739 RepID=A0A0S3SWM1_PHAAN|nr:hypothetical protein VIGAN_09044300 [Vigna angularis var. angularis]
MHIMRKKGTTWLKAKWKSKLPKCCTATNYFGKTFVNKSGSHYIFLVHIKKSLHFNSYFSAKHIKGESSYIAFVRCEDKERATTLTGFLHFWYDMEHMRRGRGHIEGSNSRQPSIFFLFGKEGYHTVHKMKEFLASLLDAGRDV